MSNHVYTLIAGDTLPALELTLTDANGDPWPLDDLDTSGVVLRYKKLQTSQPAPTALTATMEVLDANNAVVRYQFTAIEAGDYEARVEAYHTGGRVTHPNNGSFLLQIRNRL